MVMTKEQNCREAEHHGVAREEEVSEQGKHRAEYEAEGQRKGEAGSGDSDRQNQAIGNC